MARRKKVTKRKKTTRAKKTTRSRKTTEKTTKPSVFQMLAISVIAIILLFFVLGIILGNGNGNGTIDSQTQITQPAETYSCTRNSECFNVWCDVNEAVKECVNTEAMERYHEKCGGNYYDIEVKQDSSTCSCVQGYCK